MDHILITGGTHGIGRATVELLLQMGTRVSTCARNSDELTQLKAQTASDNLHITTCDIKSDSDCTRFVDEAFNRFGSISGLVNNAGEVCVGRLDSASPEDLLS
jgi:NADP-dependent 3-hydroxy acid dehydrogenase YdfG